MQALQIELVFRLCHALQNAHSCWVSPLLHLHRGPTYRGLNLASILDTRSSAFTVSYELSAQAAVFWSALEMLHWFPHIAHPQEYKIITTMHSFDLPNFFSTSQKQIKPNAKSAKDNDLN